MSGAAAYAALGPQLAWARRAGRLATPLQPWSLPGGPPVGGLDLARALIGAAVLAPSDWNTQPWRFEVEGATIRIVADSQRALPLTDPDRRGMLISLGAALENLLVAARAWGLQPTVRYVPDGGARAVMAEVGWENGGQRRDLGLFAAITQRRTNRRAYDGRGLLPEHRAALTAQVTGGPHLHWLDAPEVRRGLDDLVHDAVRTQLSDRRVRAEQDRWTRKDGKDAARRGDGVPESALDPSGWFSFDRLDPRTWYPRSAAEDAARRERDRLRSAGAVALLTVPVRGEAAWLGAGQAYERLALKATALGIAHQPQNAPLEQERFRAALLRHFGAGGQEPLMLMRLGHAGEMPPTPRRAASLVATYRNS